LASDFGDTSALAKLYIAEGGSEWATARSAANGVVISRLTTLEMASAIRRFTAKRSLSDQTREDLYARFLRDAARFQVVSITDRLVTSAGSLMLSGGVGERLRSLDAIQLATARWWFEQARALTIEPGAFVVADRPLREAAVALGLDVENPEDYA
jgi:predicted nucleic acid-binding protein